MTDFLPILPDWVLIEAAHRCGWGRGNIYDVPTLQNFYVNDLTYRALCDMIAKHEQPPVDRKLLCAREAVKEWNEIVSMKAIDMGVRAIELWEEGFGK